MQLSQCAVLNVAGPEMSRRTWSRELARRGCQVLEAATRAEALQIAARETIDFVLLDDDAFATDDGSFCQSIKTGPSPPIIVHFLSAREASSVRAKRLADGVDAFVPAEADAAELVGTMAALLRLRQAERTIREREERLGLAVAAAKMATWDWDIANGRIHWSETLEPRLRMAPGSFAGTIEAFRALVHPDDRSYVEQRLEKALAGKSDYDVEFRMLRADGTVRWTATKATVVRGPDGRPLRMVGVDVDITERKDAEAALRASELRFRGIFDGTFQLIGLLALDGTVLEVNKAALDFNGVTRAEIVGKPFWEVRSWTVSPATQEQLRRSIAAAASGSFVRYEVEVLRADGRIATIDFSLRPVRDEHGQVVFLIPEGRDITERKRMEVALRDREQLLELAHEASSVAVWDWNLITNQSVWSSEFCRLFGYELGEVEPGYAAFRARVHPDDLDALEADLRRIIETRGVFDSEFRIVRPDGVRWMLGRGRLILDKDGAPVRMIGINMDMTEKKAAEAALRHRNALIEQGAKEKNRQLAAVVHDLRQPLHSIMASLDLLMPGVQGDVYRRRLERAVGIVLRMNETLENLMMAARLESGMARPNIRIFPLDRIFDALHEGFDDIARGKGLVMAIECCAASVRSDPDLLLTIFGNLVGNAVKFTERGSVAIRATCSGEHVVVEISDTGPGIPEADLASIWDEYKQASPDLRGVGLGLAIVKRSADLLGHTVGVRSTAGQGTTFSIELPLAREGTAADC